MFYTVSMAYRLSSRLSGATVLAAGSPAAAGGQDRIRFISFRGTTCSISAQGREG